MTLGQCLAAILLSMAVSAACTWQVQGWRYGEKLTDQAQLFQADLSKISAAAAIQASAETNKRLALEQRINASDRRYTQEMSDVQRNQAVLRDRLATADVRLSVLIDAADSASGCNVPAAPRALGVVHGATRARLNPAHAQRIVGITSDGDRGLIALRACQAYARSVGR